MTAVDTTEALMEKLWQGKERMSERCMLVGKAVLYDGNVKSVTFHDRLTGWADCDTGSVRVPYPCSRQRLYILAREVGHIALKHLGKKPRHREQYEAERYAHDALKRYKIAVPKVSTQKAKNTVARQIYTALVLGARTIDHDAFHWCKETLAFLVFNDHVDMTNIALEHLS